MNGRRSWAFVLTCVVVGAIALLSMTIVEVFVSRRDAPPAPYRTVEAVRSRRVLLLATTEQNGQKTHVLLSVDTVGSAPRILYRWRSGDPDVPPDAFPLRVGDTLLLETGYGTVLPIAFSANGDRLPDESVAWETPLVRNAINALSWTLSPDGSREALTCGPVPVLSGDVPGAQCDNNALNIRSLGEAAYRTVTIPAGEPLRSNIDTLLASGWSADGKSVYVQRGIYEFSVSSNLWIVDVASRMARHVSAAEGFNGPLLLASNGTAVASHNVPGGLDCSGVYGFEFQPTTAEELVVVNLHENRRRALLRAERAHLEPVAFIDGGQRVAAESFAIIAHPENENSERCQWESLVVQIVDVATGEIVERFPGGLLLPWGGLLERGDGRDDGILILAKPRPEKGWRAVYLYDTARRAAFAARLPNLGGAVVNVIPLGVASLSKPP